MTGHVGFDSRVLRGVFQEVSRVSRNAALAAIGKGELTQRGTVLGAISGHGSLQKERLDLGFLGSLAEARRTTERKQSTRATIMMSIKLRAIRPVGGVLLAKVRQ